ncbi:hypothetical protein [Methylovulum psychrotolerans]|uniref:hypothetical protein n=1 Tax=Methylovulum psychrotolerans TaxID=1704499 RepID=UPI0012F77941|nr:hypothetical protein [Methylovulum psychrotolerans]
MKKQIMSRYRDDFLIGFSHPKARYFLLLRQKKVSKEKAARLPLLPALLGFVGGSAEWAPAHLPTRGIPAAPLRANPEKTCDARRGKREKDVTA